MIPKTIRSQDIVGRMVRLEHDITRLDGLFLPRGTLVKIVSARFGLEGVTQKCPACGCSHRVKNIRRRSITLVGEEKSPALEEARRELKALEAILNERPADTQTEREALCAEFYSSLRRLTRLHAAYNGQLRNARIVDTGPLVTGADA